ncbi:AAA family ATPase [Alienimonas sp. DA493]|uniref:AAA family ATPase n=1 Tax=Alienimonas sp. DA493 TaxID=3373605 RepID=UPI00375516DB
MRSPEPTFEPKPRLLIVAGPNGSGKTTVTEQGLAHEWFAGCEYINPDAIARDEFGDWNDPAAVLAAAKAATARREACLADGRSFAFETVFSGPDKVDFVRRGLAAGFFVRLFFVCTENATINAARVARRVMEGGHEVPLRKIIDRWGRSLANCGMVAAEVDRLYLYDNSVDGEPARLILRAADGEVIKHYGPVPAWAKPIAETLRERSN